MNQERHQIFDFVLVGGGLQSGLIALALNHHQPHARVLMVERSDRLGGNHTWSFHRSDIPTQARHWLAGIPTTNWDAYNVNFPGFRRRVPLPYAAIRSADFADTLEQLATQSALTIWLETDVSQVLADRIRIADGTEVRAQHVLDCRGRALSECPSGCGYQEFVGFEVELHDRDWIDSVPMIMDASLDQSHGFRFMYVLPFGQRRVLFEQTRFSNQPTMQRDEALADLHRYLSDHGFEDWRIVREESGCLPMPYTAADRGLGLVATDSTSADRVLRGGYAGGWFHAATGYSMPLAVSFADAVASSSHGELVDRVRNLRCRHQFQTRFARFLNRMLFYLVSPDRRWTIFRRFYRNLSQPTIERFYAHRFSRLDACRILLGRPPRGLTPFHFLKSFRTSS